MLYGTELVIKYCFLVFTKATLWMKAQHEGALPPPGIVRKDPRVPHTSRKVVSSLNNLRCKRSSIPPQNMRPDTPEQTQQGPCDLSQIRLQEVRSRTLTHPVPGEHGCAEEGLIS